ncbi:MULTISPECIES: GlxA family transcriptional regulator [Bradyrhizobium]|uniref:AraC family transcriptional regulator n=1 Tax=Bradyrhizobium canariense TaxID=255045 RepID=A0A1X3FZJ7_9BRAD|nr:MULTISPECIES: GlxA family transcriptional regulator [Bradyrhizobium]OSI71636.1 AraC family transcriptional regulator [Bradyrhizobium canariense]OSI80598.1 AraC family transcriptional regulator [Bradyrhizobium canariense]OSI91184.1 AraC family transcriptional regulator [Bradyrhizobium canariense]OSI96257.1 AraC family transcriptional regulator [Bradyrhizobium canariense]OSJ09237.1 AraC family transcriptional regulator [Bradyrhizobium canariense]
MPVQAVAIVVYEGVQALDVAGPLDVFSEANTFLDSADRYEPVLVAAHHNPLRASNGIRLIADLTLEEATGGFDIVLVAGTPTPPETEPDPHLLQWVKELPWRSSLYGSICTGAFVLGYAGLLDDRRVTTHWQDAQALAARFPRAKVEPDLIYVRDGRLITAAGVTAGIDLGLALVGQRHGAETALKVAKRLVVVAQRQGGQSQFSPYLTAPADPESPIARIQDHVMTNVGDRHSLESLAAVVGMSARNLARHFVQATGITPHEFIERARIDAARMMLEGSDRPLKAVAFDCGFGSADRMRIVFTARLGVSPIQYRASFRRTTLE